MLLPQGGARAAHCEILLCLTLAIGSAGCARDADPAYVFSEELSQLPASHQDQIRTRMVELFGTPVNPRLVIPAGDDVDAEGQPLLTDVFELEQLQRGSQVFERRCLGCHGVTGDGAGEAAAYLQPKPRDYRRGTFKFTSTPFGAKPHRADLVRVVRWGAKGTSMPSFRFLPEEDVEAVVDYVIMLSYRGEVERSVVQIVGLDYDEDESIDDFEYWDSLERVHNAWQLARDQVALPVSAAPRYSDESILAGRRAFLSRGCSKCHGEDGRGQTDWLSHEFIAEQESRPPTERIQINYDNWGEVAPAADLTARMLHGGRRPIDIYRRIYTGINGTPMPAFSLALADEPETVWHLVHYVLSIIEGREVAGLEEIEPTDVPQPDAGAG